MVVSIYQLALSSNSICFTMSGKQMFSFQFFLIDSSYLSSHPNHTANPLHTI